MRFFAIAAFFAGASLLGATSPASALDVSISYLRVVVPAPPTLSNLDPIPEDLGHAGAALAIADNATTGGFLGHAYTLSTTEVEDGNVAAAARAALADIDIVVFDGPAEALLAIADSPEAEGALIFNVTAPDRDLRDDACRKNVLHTAASNDMRADALMQFLSKRRWTDLAMVVGAHPRDRAFADALGRAATKFGLNVVGEKAWTFDADMRRNAAQEAPLFLQDFDAHDVLLIADEIDDFGRYLPYNSWTARPVAGSEGLTPASWSPVVEQWGAAQLQSRFHKAADRSMRPRDYAAWAAVRAVGEAVTRTNAADAGAALSSVRRLCAGWI